MSNTNTDTTVQTDEGKVLEDTQVPQDSKQVPVEVLVAERKKRQDLEAELKALKDKPDVDVLGIVEKALADRDSKYIESHKEQAIAKFKASNEMFDADNDPEGEKFAALKKEFESFNLDGVDSEAGFTQFLNKANTLIGGAQTKEVSGTPSYSATPGSSTATQSAQEGTVNHSFSKEEKAAIIAAGKTTEWASDMKKKYPGTFDSILEDFMSSR